MHVGPPEGGPYIAGPPEGGSYIAGPPESEPYVKEQSQEKSEE